MYFKNIIIKRSKIENQKKIKGGQKHNSIQCAALWAALLNNFECMYFKKILMIKDQNIEKKSKDDKSKE